MEFHILTQLVNVFRAGAQLQSIKTFRTKQDTWALELDFFPAPRRLLFCLKLSGAPGASSPLMGAWTREKGSWPELSAAPHPLQLYLRAHFSNLRLRSASFRAESESLWLDFGPRPAQIEISGQREQLRAKLSVVDRKDYSAQLKLAEVAPAPLGDSAAALEELTSTVAPAATQNHQAHLRLVENVRRDLQSAQEWIDQLGPLCELLEQDASRWGRGDFPPELRIRAEQEIAQGQLPAFAPQFVGLAQDKLFGARRRALRKKEGGMRRLAQIERPGFAASYQTRQARQASAAETSARSVENRGAGKPLSQKKPGLWVEIEALKLWARVGRSATENAELFRQARDRDLWFHVRGQAGGHVWIPRGQAALGNKAEVPERVVEVGCQLALFNSKARKSHKADVDYTERRHLKQVKGGAVGEVQILRSQVRFVRLDEEFERMIRGK